ncbi:hypothetical protein GCM10027294_19880 [Marinactinospora endophytica]
MWHGAEGTLRGSRGRDEPLRGDSARSETPGLGVGAASRRAAGLRLAGGRRRHLRRPGTGEARSVTGNGHQGAAHRTGGPAAPSRPFRSPAPRIASPDRIGQDRP